MNAQFLNRDELLTEVRRAPRPEDQALLVAARFLPVRALERLALLLEAPTVAQMVAMDHYAVERCIGRPLRATKWDPRTLLTETQLDQKWLSTPDRRHWWIGDEDYPEHMQRIWDPPAVLFGWGVSETLAWQGVAVVGTREPDDEGRSAAYRLGLELGQQGVVVVSGLARGIDAYAHRGAVVSGTPALAVLGCGVDAVYPRENRALAADLLDEGGLILSEYPPGTPPARQRFPARNRIVVGLSAGVVVVQAPERSGALISADFGLQNGVEVMVHQAGRDWTGCRRLLADGAGIVTGAADVLARVAPEAMPERSEQAAAEAPLQAEKRKLALLGLEQPEVSL